MVSNDYLNCPQCQTMLFPLTAMVPGSCMGHGVVGARFGAITPERERQAAPTAFSLASRSPHAPSVPRLALRLLVMEH